MPRANEKLDLRPVLSVAGLLLTFLALSMMIPVIATINTLGNSKNTYTFVISSAITAFFGCVVILANKTENRHLSPRQHFLLLTVVSFTLPTFAALPFILSDLNLSYANAFFEATSGLTATGSTVITDIDAVSWDLLLWRAILQWIGGIGIVLTAYLVLPLLGIGGMQLFRVEITDTHEHLASWVFGIKLISVYIILTVLWALILWALGMTGLDAVIHAMTTISTGGFSTSDQSLAIFNDIWIEAVTVIGMIVGSLPFLLYLQSARGTPEILLHDTQVRIFFLIIGISATIISIWLWLVSGQSLLRAIGQAIFATTSLITGTGYAIESYWQWGGLSTAVLFFLIFVGGCAGSTTCAVKVFRFQILYATAKTQMAKLLQPHGVFIPYYYSYRSVPKNVAETVLGFFFLYTVTFAVVTLSLSLIGLDFMSAFLAAATALSNVSQGNSLSIGPCIFFTQLPDSAKWVLSVTMLVGRLEVLSVLVLFLPNFWRT